jgi:methyl-accepting chemotaxis protein
MTLNQKIFSGCAVLLTSMFALAVTVWFMMSETAQDAASVKANRVPQLQRVADIELNVTRASLQTRHLILARTPEEAAATLADIQRLVKALDESVDAFGKGMTTEAGRQAFKPLPGLLDNFKAVATQNIELVQKGQKAEAFAFLVDKTIPARNALLTPLNAEKNRQGTVLSEELDTVIAEAYLTLYLTLGAVGLVLVIGVGGTVFLTRTMRQLGGDPQDLKRVADAVAQGDLTLQVPVQPGDTNSIIAALKTMQDNLATTVRAVRQNADSVATASAEIASGNLDLSQRTEQQASALEQTASSMEQLGSTVRQNADSARKASELAQTSVRVAEAGETTVREVVDTMRGINESSRKIADIIGTIDGIAFQTNILALNAAVEAARAGEQGRGFAVVAGEVRNLAQRSAEAAREIKALIGTSVERVEQGTQMVDRAGSTMQEIMASIRRVTAIINEISAASTEQAQGVQQVGAAVAEMDRSTQQNAALVEEGAASAESLKQQSQQLVAAVSAFRVHG